MSIVISIALLVIYAKHPTVGFSGSGGAGKTPSLTKNLCWLAAHTLKRRSRCPLQTVLARF
jgi:hypothetical protein